MFTFCRIFIKKDPYWWQGQQKESISGNTKCQICFMLSFYLKIRLWTTASSSVILGNNWIFSFAKEIEQNKPKTGSKCSSEKSGNFLLKGSFKDCVDSWRCVSIHFLIFSNYVFSLHIEWTVNFFLSSLKMEFVIFFIC